MNEQTAYAKTITGIYNKVYQGKNIGKVLYTEYCQSTFAIYGV